MKYVVRINEIVYHHFKKTELFIHLDREMLKIYDGNLTVLLKTIEDLYFEMNDRRKEHIMKTYTERPARNPKPLTEQQIKERTEQNALNDKHIKEHIEFNERNGFYKDMPKIEEITYQNGKPIPNLRTVHNKPKKIQYLYYLYDSTGIHSPLDEGIDLQ